jgi:hypothetical protein
MDSTGPGLPVVTDALDRALLTRFLAGRKFFVAFGLLVYDIVVASIGLLEVIRGQLDAKTAENAGLVDIP